MKYKKPLIFIAAIIAIIIALYGLWSWQKNLASEPVRQEKEIR
jgi:hypothetical protein